MHSVIHLLACLACVSYGRRVQALIEQSHERASSGKRKALTSLVLALSPSAAFNPFIPRAPLASILSAHTRTANPLLPRKELEIRHRAPAMSFLAFFMNPLDLLAPSTGPISAEQKNFAVPEHPNLVIVNEDPPVYEIPGFLNETECAELIAAAETGSFPKVPYGRKNKIFTGTKWAAAGTEVITPFLEKSKMLWDVPQSRFEPVTVTKYTKGEYQAKHLDSRLEHEIVRNEEHWKTGGQRIAQVIVYLQPPTAGGTTKFFNPVFKNLEVIPEAGKALVFPTCDLDGQADERYLHSGEPVQAGDKYIVGTWLMQKDRKDAKDIKKQMRALWNLQRKRSAA